MATICIYDYRAENLKIIKIHTRICLDCFGVFLKEQISFCSQTDTLGVVLEVKLPV